MVRKILSFFLYKILDIRGGSFTRKPRSFVRKWPCSKNEYLTRDKNTCWCH